MNTAPNPSSLSRRIGLALMAFAVASCAADDASDPPRLASLMEGLPAMSTESPDSTKCVTSQRPATSIRLEGAHGEALELAYFVDCGWKYIAANRDSASEARPAKVTYQQASAPEGAGLEDPMTVFIDGPTGYTFAWTATGGWKFIGHLRP